jgi:purine-nucleoside phosphorylase
MGIRVVGILRPGPLSDVYARPFPLDAFRAAHDLGLQCSALSEGSYKWVRGPAYKMRGEASWQLLASTDATVVGGYEHRDQPEVVPARKASKGVRVLVLSFGH